MFRGFVVFVILMATPLATSAQGPSQTGPGTTSIGFNEIRSGGVLVGCELDFDQTLSDTAEFPPRVVEIVGALSWIIPKPQHLALTLKVQPFDRVQVGAQSQRLGFTPTTAYVILGGVSSAGREYTKFPCSGGGFCGAIAEPALLSVSVAALQGFRLGYQREAGNVDVLTDIQMPSFGQPQWQNVQAISRCLSALLSTLP